LYFAKVQKQSQLTTLNAQFDDLEVQMSQPGIALIDQTATRLSGGLDTLNKLISNQILYSQLFTELNKIIPNEVVVQNISIESEQNIVNFSANAPTLDDSAKLIKSLKNADFFSNVVLVSDAESQVGGNKIFSVSLTMAYNPDALTTPEEVTNEVNATAGGTQ
jgi:hypothetical protein